MKKKWSFPVLEFFTAFVLMVFAITFSIIFTLNFKPLYYFDVDYLSISASSGFSKDLILQNYDILITYNSIFSNKDLIFEGLAMSATGKIHFEEVRDIFVIISYLCLISSLLSALFVLLNIRKKKINFFLWASIGTVLIPIFVGLIMYSNWDFFFTFVHKILFRNDYWYFDPVTDPIIRILPNEFFMHCAILIVIVILFFSVIFLVLYFLFKRKLYKNKICTI